MVLAQCSLVYICGYFVFKFPSSDILVGIYRTTALLLRKQQLHHTAVRNQSIRQIDLTTETHQGFSSTEPNILRKMPSVAQKEHHWSQN